MDRGSPESRNGTHDPISSAITYWQAGNPSNGGRARTGAGEKPMCTGRGGAGELRHHNGVPLLAVAGAREGMGAVIARLPLNSAPYFAQWLAGWARARNEMLGVPWGAMCSRHHRALAARVMEFLRLGHR